MIVYMNFIYEQGQTVTPESLSQTYPLVYAADVENPGTTNATTYGY